MEERRLLMAQFDAERQRRRRLIEEKGDIELSIRELFGVELDDTAQVRSAGEPWKGLCGSYHRGC